MSQKFQRATLKHHPRIDARMGGARNPTLLEYLLSAPHNRSHFLYWQLWFLWLMKMRWVPGARGLSPDGLTKLYCISLDASKVISF